MLPPERLNSTGFLRGLDRLGEIQVRVERGHVGRGVPQHDLRDIRNRLAALWLSQ